MVPFLSPIAPHYPVVMRTAVSLFLAAVLAGVNGLAPSTSPGTSSSATFTIRKRVEEAAGKLQHARNLHEGKSAPGSGRAAKPFDEGPLRDRSDPVPQFRWRMVRSSSSSSDSPGLTQFCSGDPYHSIMSVRAGRL